MSKFIIGNGISGLIWKFYNPEFELIGPVQIGAGGLQAPDNFSRSYMVWLHDCPETRQLAEDLNFKDVENKLRQSRIGYYVKGVIRDHLTEPLKQVLVDKKMTPWDLSTGLLVKQVKPEEPSRLSLTGTTKGVNFMNVLDIDHSSLIWRLRNRTQTTHGFIGQINEATIGITNSVPTQDSGYTYSKYDTLVSTIPAPQFYRAYQGKVESPSFDSVPITFVTVQKKPAEFDGDYEMVYYDDSVPFTRISHLHGKYCIEFTGELSEEKFREMYPGVRIFDMWTLKGGRIVSQKLTPPQENIIFSGRFAQWDHKITTEHVIKQAMEYKNGAD